MSGMKATTMPSVSPATDCASHLSTRRLTDRCRQQGPVALVVELTAANTGKVAGTTVVQVYCIDPVMDYVRPWKRLLAFARVTLAAGQSKPVRIDVTAARSLALASVRRKSRSVCTSSVTVHFCLFRQVL